MNYRVCLWQFYLLILTHLRGMDIKKEYRCTPTFVNLKSNTLKNTLQRYGLLINLQIIHLKYFVLLHLLAKTTSDSIYFKENESLFYLLPTNSVPTPYQVRTKSKRIDTERIRIWHGSDRREERKQHRCVMFSLSTDPPFSAIRPDIVLLR